ncbi:hypothetical protein CEXT_563181 [Caerostris extrusa]|uniref:Uncharacterized protein n=1 Tax=Caerostris extrusa TaxID=172846 RepID=A0AAV4MZK3_CAEEX|nr:hypothetical protein CEXT_563181 [Caerostris extrusa]
MNLKIDVPVNASIRWKATIRHGPELAPLQCTVIRIPFDLSCLGWLCICYTETIQGRAQVCKIPNIFYGDLLRLGTITLFSPQTKIVFIGIELRTDIMNEISI